MAHIGIECLAARHRQEAAPITAKAKGTALHKKVIAGRGLKAASMAGAFAIPTRPRIPITTNQTSMRPEYAAKPGRALAGP
jgi:hypothetical protein